MSSEKPGSEISKRVDKIFKDLRDVKGLVNVDHELISGDNFESQKLLITKRKWIKYPKKRLERKHLSDDAIRWALLHEEGHLSEHKGQGYFILGFIVYLLGLYLISLSTDVFENIFHHLWDNPLKQSILFLLIALLSYQLFRFTILRQTEYKCDWSAGKKIKNHYDVKNPSTVTEKLVKWYKKTREEKHITKRIWPSIKNFLLDPHPSWEKRIKRIEELDEDD